VYPSYVYARVLNGIFRRRRLCPIVHKCVTRDDAGGFLKSVERDGVSPPSEYTARSYFGSVVHLAAQLVTRRGRRESTETSSLNVSTLHHTPRTVRRTNVHPSHAYRDIRSFFRDYRYCTNARLLVIDRFIVTQTTDRRRS